MYCPTCGAENGEGASYCEQCGAALPVGFNQQQPPPASQSSDSDILLWAMFCHLSTFIAGFIGPLVIWLIKKDESYYIDYHGKEALNFQISVFIYAVVCGLLSIVLIGIPLAIALAIFNIVVVVIASVKAHNGEYYNYPLNLRLIR